MNSPLRAAMLSLRAECSKNPLCDVALRRLRARDGSFSDGLLARGRRGSPPRPPGRSRKCSARFFGGSSLDRREARSAGDRAHRGRELEPLFGPARSQK